MISVSVESCFNVIDWTPRPLEFFHISLSTSKWLFNYKYMWFFLDIDECIIGTNRNNCDENASCTNTFGGFTCTCNDGYEGDGVTCTPSTPTPTKNQKASSKYSTVYGHIGYYIHKRMPFALTLKRPSAKSSLLFPRGWRDTYPPKNSFSGSFLHHW